MAEKPPTMNQRANMQQATSKPKRANTNRQPRKQAIHMSKHWEIIVSCCLLAAILVVIMFLFWAR